MWDILFPVRIRPASPAPEGPINPMLAAARNVINVLREQPPLCPEPIQPASAVSQANTDRDMRISGTFDCLSLF